MYRPGADHAAMSMQDVLCDFCGRTWSEDLPMVEGHRGSCICGHCLRVAFVELVWNAGGESPGTLPEGLGIGDLIPGAPALDAPRSDEGRVIEPCCLCMQTAPDAKHWRSPLSDAAEPGPPAAAGTALPPHRHKLACRSCITMAARALEMDKDIDWQRPKG